MKFLIWKDIPVFENPHPARIHHCWYNESEGILRFLVIKAPRPTKATRLL